MKKQLWFLLVAVGLLLMVVSVHAQGGRTSGDWPHPLMERDFLLNQNEMRPDALTNMTRVPVGEPGLTFRYVREFGHATIPYIEDGQHFNDPSSVTIAPDGSIWISEWNGMRTVQYNRNGVFQRAIGRAGFGERVSDDVFGPVADTLIDDDGNIWVSLPDNHHVRKFNSAGEFILQIGDEWQCGNDNDHFCSPRGLAVDDNGNLFVADRYNHRIQVFSKYGAYLNTIGESAVPGNNNSHFNNPVHIAIQDNRLYVVDRGNYRVQIFDISNPLTPVFVATIGVTGAPGDDNAHFVGPYGVAVDAHKIYVVDLDGHRVQIFDKNTLAYLTTLGTGKMGSGQGEFSFPSNVDVDSQGNIYVSEYGNHRVQKFDDNYAYVSILGVTGIPYVPTAGYYNNPTGLASAPDGGLIVAEKRGQRVVKIAPDGSEAWIAGRAGVRGDDENHFSEPAGVAVGPSGKIYVTEEWNDRVHILNPDGSHAGFFGSHGNGNNQFSAPYGIAIDSTGNIYVVDTGNHRVQIFDSSFNYKATLGVTSEAGDDNAHFRWPKSVAVDSRGFIYVGDDSNGRVQVFDQHYAYQRTMGGIGCTNLFEGFCGTYGLAVDAEDRLYVADTWNDRVQVFDRTGAYLTTIGGKSGTGLGEMHVAGGVAVAANGQVFISDSNNHRIYQFAQGLPGWRQVNINGFGKRENWAVWSLGSFKNQLYASTGNHHTGAEVYRYDAHANAWEQVVENGFGDDVNRAVNWFTEFKGKFYASTWNGGDGGQIWRSATGDAGSWQKVVDKGFNDEANNEIMAMAVFKDYLYAGTWVYDTNHHGAEIWRSPTGDNGSWSWVFKDAISGNNHNSAFLSMQVFNDALYATTQNEEDGGEIWRTTDGVNWSKAALSGFGNSDNIRIVSLAVFGGYLYAGTWNSETGAQIWRTNDGSHWTKIVSDGFGKATNKQIASLVAYDNQIVAVVGNWDTGPEVWESNTGDAGDWLRIANTGFGGGKAAAVNWDNVTAVVDDQLYVATFASRGFGGGRVWQRQRSLFLPLALR